MYILADGRLFFRNYRFIHPIIFFFKSLFHSSYLSPFHTPKIGVPKPNFLFLVCTVSSCASGAFLPSPDSNNTKPSAVSIVFASLQFPKESD